MPGGNFKLSNVLGVPFRAFVRDQLVTRAIVGTRNNRTLSETLYLGNQLSWVRLLSSVEVRQDYIDALKQGFANEPDSFLADWTATGLAKNWILQSGTSKVTQKGIDLRSGIGYDGAYGLGGIQAQGYRPMPGITNVQIESAGKLGSLRYATINFKVWNMNQLDIMDALYFRLGYTMLLEWGHVQYFENLKDPANPQGTEKLIAGAEGINGFFEDYVTKEDIQFKINQKVVETQGNYDGMLGVVTNFDYAFNQEGGWDCSIKLIGLGSIMESQKINIPYQFPPGLAKAWQRVQSRYEANKRAEIKKRLDEINSGIINSNTSDANTAINKYNADYPIHNVKDFYTYAVRGGKPAASEFTDGPTGTKDGSSFQQGITSYIRLVADLSIFATEWENTNGYAIYSNLSTKTGMQINPWEDYSGYYKDNYLRFGIPGGNDNSWRYGLTLTTPVDLKSTLFNYLTSKASLTDSRLDIGGVLYGKLPSPHSIIPPRMPALGTFWFDYNDASTILQANQKGLTLLNNSTGLGRVLVNCYRYGKFESAAKGKALEILKKPEKLSFNNPTSPFELLNASRGEREYSNAYSLVTAVRVPKPTNPSATGLLTSNDTLRAYISDVDALPDNAVLDYDSLFENLANIFSTADPYQGWIVDKLIDVPPPSAQSFTFSVSTTEVFLKKTFTATASDLIYYKSTGDYDYTPITGKVGWTVKRDNQQRYTGPLNITVTLVTTMLNLIENVGVPSGAGFKPPTPRPLQKADYDAARLDSSVQAIGLESSLQAMLTLVKYDTLVAYNNPPLNKISKHSLTNITQKFLTEGSGSFSPLKAIFTGQDIPTSIASTIAAVGDGPQLFTDPSTTGIKGYSTALMQDYNYTNNNTTTYKERYDKVPTVDFSEMFNSYLLPRYVLQSATDKPDKVLDEYQVYIPFGYLMFFLNTNCLLYDTSKSSPVAGIGGNASRSIIYLDFNPETNLCMTMPSQLSSDPSVCLIPFNGTGDDYKQIFQNNLPTEPLLNPATAQAAYANVPPFAGTSKYHGRTMNILLNVNYLLDLIKSTTDKDGHNNVYLQPFLDSVVTAINKSLGDVNAFRVSYNDASNTVTIQDDQYVPPTENEEKTIFDADANELRQKLLTVGGFLQMPVFGMESLATSFTFKTDTSTRMSREIAIGAQAANSGSVQGVDASSYHWLNTGITDRVIQVKDNVTTLSTGTTPTAAATGKTNKNKKKGKKGAATKTATTTATTNDDPTKLLPEKFNSHVKSYYELTINKSKPITHIYKELIDPARNYLIQGATKVKANDKNSTSTLVIPLNTTMTITGISGIMMGNAFLLPEKILPITLRGTTTETRFGFYVMGLSHTLDSNRWTTSIKGQIVRIRTEKNTYGALARISTSALTDLTKANALNDLKQAILDNPSYILYLIHNQGPAGAEIILKYTFQEPVDILPPGSLLYGVTGTEVQGNMANNYNKNTAQKYFKTPLPLTPANFIRVQLAKYLDLYNTAQSKHTYDKIFNDVITNNAANVALEEARVVCYLESGFNPNKTGIGTNGKPTKYKGLFGIDQAVFLKYNPKGTNIFDPAQNAFAGIKLLSENKKMAQKLIDKYIG